MEKEINSYQTKIEEARKKLPEESRRAIDSVNWKEIIQGLKNYTLEQLDALEIETELLLYGITEPEDYPVELEKRMLLTKEQVNQLLDDLDKLIFKKIQEELESIIARQNIKIPENKAPETIKDYDKRFIGLPQEVQNAIAVSGMKEKLYKISQDHKLNVEQMGILDDVIVNLILNTTNADESIKKLINVGINESDSNKIIDEINTNILKNIRENEKVITNDKLPINNESANTATKIEEEIPLPPYKVITNDQLPINNENANTENKPTNPLEEKLMRPTISTQNTPNSTTNSSKNADPYREVI